MTFDDVRKIALALPGVDEGTSYGTPAFKVKGKFLGRLREDDETLVVRIDMLTREALLQSDPDVFYITDHYRNYPAILVRLTKVSEEALRDLVEDAWLQVAPKKLTMAHR